MGVSNNVKRQIIEREIELLENTIYAQTLKGRIAGDVGNKELQKSIMSELEVYTQTKDKYEAELQKISDSETDPA